MEENGEDVEGEGSLAGSEHLKGVVLIVEVVLIILIVEVVIRGIVFDCMKRGIIAFLLFKYLRCGVPIY